MSAQRFFGEHIKRHTLNAAGGTDEALVDDFVSEPDRFEDLRTFVTLQRADAHLGHHFQHAFGDTLAVSRDDLVVVQSPDPSSRRGGLATAIRRPGTD